MCNRACPVALCLIQLAQSSLHNGQRHHVVGQPVDRRRAEGLFESRDCWIRLVCPVIRSAGLEQNIDWIFANWSVWKAIRTLEFGNGFESPILGESNLALNPVYVRRVTESRGGVTDLRNLS